MMSPTIAPKPGETERAFEPVRLLAMKLNMAAERAKLLAVDDPAWQQVWNLAAQFDAVDRSVRRKTTWTKCAFGPKRACPSKLLVKCVSCNGKLDSPPRYVWCSEVEVITNPDGRREDLQDLYFPPLEQDPWRKLIELGLPRALRTV